MQGLKDEVLGKQSSGKLLSLVLPFPLPKFLKQILMGDITFEQFLNNTPEIKQAIENAEEKTFKKAPQLDPKNKKYKERLARFNEKY